MVMRVPLVDLRAQYQSIKYEVLMAVEGVFDQMQLFLGPQQHAFEEAFAAYCGSQYGIGLSNGTDALILALRACGIGPCDEVITVSNTFIATVEAIVQVGATPVFVDIDPKCDKIDTVAPLGGESMGPGWYWCNACRFKFTVRVG